MYVCARSLDQSRAPLHFVKAQSSWHYLFWAYEWRKEGMHTYGWRERRGIRLIRGSISTPRFRRIQGALHLGVLTDR